MEDCDFQPLLPAYHDHELDAGSVARLTEHVRDCPACSAELAVLCDISARIGSAPLAGMDPSESARLHSAIERAGNELDGRPLFRTAGLLAALAASVLIVSGVWLLDTRPVPGMASPMGPVSQLAAAPEWERVAVTLRADPRPTVAGESVFYALRSSATVDWMLDGLVTPR